jgi:hypothetical protein
MVAGEVGGRTQGRKLAGRVTTGSRGAACREVDYGGIPFVHYTPALVCLLVRDMGDMSQGHRTVDMGPKIGT